MQREDLEKSLADLTERFETLKAEHVDLKHSHLVLERKLEVTTKAKDNHEVTISEKSIRIEKLERDLQAAKLDLGEVSLEKAKADQKNDTLSKYIESQTSDQVSQEKYLKLIMSERDSVNEQLENLKMRHERDRGKLKFYKGEYYSFDLARKDFEQAI